MKIQPHNKDAEMAVLGGIMLEVSAINKAAEIITADDFYIEQHRKFFRAMLSLSEKQAGCDFVSMTDELKSAGVYGAEDTPYLLQLADFIPISSNISYYAKIVKEKALLRRLITVVSEIATRAYDEKEDVGELLDLAQKNILGLSENSFKSQCMLAKDLIKTTFNRLQELYERKECITGVPTGYYDLDKMTAGLQPGDLVIIAARPSMGKTALALNIASNACLHDKHPVPSVVFSLEMSSNSLVERLLSSLSHVDASRMRTGRFIDTDWPKLQRGAASIHNAMLYLDDTASISVMELRAKARNLKRMVPNLGLIVVDYLQLMRSSSRHENRVQEISEISRSLKALAKELNVPVVALSQLNRTLENRSDKRPMMSDLRESGAIEQDADVIMFVYRESVYCDHCRKKDGSCTANHERSAEVIIGKQRNGPTGTVELTFMGEFARFENLQRGE